MPVSAHAVSSGSDAAGKLDHAFVENASRGARFGASHASSSLARNVDRTPE